MASIYHRTVYNSAVYGLNLIINKNGGDTAPASVSGYTTSNAASVTVSKSIPSTKPTRAGYRFLGYSMRTASDSVSKQPGDMMQVSFGRIITGSTTSSYTDPQTGDRYITVTYSLRNQAQDIYLFAQWELLAYTISYDATGGTGAPASQTKTHGTALTLSSVVPAREGYVFDGWATTLGGPAVYQPGDSYTVDGDATLYAVWHLAGAVINTVTSPVEIGGGGTVSWNSFGPNFTYKLEISCADAPTVTILKGAGETSANFTIPSSWLSHIVSSQTGTATATLTTYDGDTALGSSVKTFTVTVPASVVPSISSFTAAHTSTNATVAGWGKYTQGFSKANLSVSAVAGTGATIASVAFSGPSINQTGSDLTAQTGVLNMPGVNTFTVTVTDSRGRTATATVSVTVFPYSTPVIIDIATMRADDDGTTNNSAGAYLKVMPVYSLSSVDGSNSFVAQTLSYCQHDAGTPVATITCASGTTYGPPTNMWPISLAEGYDVTVTVEDALGGIASALVTLPNSGGIWYGRLNDRLGLGAAPPGPGFYNFWKSFFKDDVTFDGDATFNGNIHGITTDAVPQTGADGFLVRSNNVVGQKELMKPLFHREPANGWSSGSVTVDGISDYHVFLVRMCNASDSIYGAELIGTLGSNRADGQPTSLVAFTFNGTGSTMLHLAFQASVSGDTLTMGRAAYINGTSVSTGQKIIDIVGVI